MEKVERSGIRMCDFIIPEVFKEKLFFLVEKNNKVIENVYKREGLDAQKIFDEYSEYAKRLSKYVTDTSVVVFDSINEKKQVLFEGAQGTLLDIDLGTYPYVRNRYRANYDR
jgi:adenylosuccinate synthase